MLHLRKIKYASEHCHFDTFLIWLCSCLLWYKSRILPKSAKSLSGFKLKREKILLFTSIANPIQFSMNTAVCLSAMQEQRQLENPCPKFSTGFWSWISIWALLNTAISNLLFLQCNLVYFPPKIFFPFCKQRPHETRGYLLSKNLKDHSLYILKNQQPTNFCFEAKCRFLVYQHFYAMPVFCIVENMHP